MSAERIAELEARLSVVAQQRNMAFDYHATSEAALVIARQKILDLETQIAHLKPRIVPAQAAPE